MEVTVSRYVDASEPNAEGYCDYHYEYDVYQFSLGGSTYAARCCRMTKPSWWLFGQKGSFRDLHGFLKGKTNGRVLSVEEINDAIADSGAMAGANKV